VVLSLMKSTRKHREILILPKSANALEVEKELAAIDRTYKRVSKSRKSAREFLQRAGILDDNGKLSERYR